MHSPTGEWPVLSSSSTEKQQGLDRAAAAAGRTTARDPAVRLPDGERPLVLPRLHRAKY